MVKLVDTGDLKSPARKGVPVRFRVWAPRTCKSLTKFAKKPLRNQKLRGFFAPIATKFANVQFWIGRGRPVPVRCRHCQGRAQHCACTMPAWRWGRAPVGCRSAERGRV